VTTLICPVVKVFFICTKTDHLGGMKDMHTYIHALRQVSYLFPEALIPRCSTDLVGCSLLQEIVSRLIVIDDLSFHSTFYKA